MSVRRYGRLARRILRAPNVITIQCCTLRLSAPDAFPTNLQLLLNTLVDVLLRRAPVTTASQDRDHCNFAYSALASRRMGTSAYLTRHGASQSSA
jgi:hypothetical protein